MLSPQDLINLSRVDANFRRTLTANNVSFVWRAVRGGEEGIKSPRGIPEYRWVDLLFGTSTATSAVQRSPPLTGSFVDESASLA